MKLVIAHIAPEHCEPIRRDLVRLAIRSITVSEMHRLDHNKAITLRYRGATLHHRAERKVKLECIVPSSEVQAVTNIVLNHAGEETSDTIVCVIPIDRLHPVTRTTEPASYEASAPISATAPEEVVTTAAVPAGGAPAPDGTSERMPAVVGVIHRSLRRPRVALPLRGN